ncbi:MAG TPA: lasso peptide biosynthesis B2 protein [Pseudonocardiaceae bacterium]|nr:lasso peptide biosynthesis B2 protein [Pseudonocardiaceae bacterium]
MRAAREFLRIVRSPTLRWSLPVVLVSGFVEIALRAMPLPRLSRLLGVALRLEPDDPHDEPAGPGSPAGLDARDAARYLATCRVLRRWPGARTGVCLRLALVAGCLLRHRRPGLHLGVAHVDGHTVAHAWLTIDGIVLDPTAYRYTPLGQGGVS